MRHGRGAGIETGNGYLEDVPTRVLLEEARYQGARFARAEIDLVREELEEEARAFVRGAAMGAAGGTLLHASVFALATFGIALLSLWLPLWAAALIVAGALALVGVPMVAAGRARVRAVRLDRTLNEFKEGREWFRQTTHDMTVRRHARI